MFDILSPRSNLIVKDTNVVQFYEEMEQRYMEIPSASHFETGITMRHKLSAVEFP